MAPTQREQIERLSAENVELKEKVNSLVETVDQLKATLEGLSVGHGETVVRVEAVEDNLCLIKTEQRDLERDLTSTMLRLEGQQMYSRKQTLLLTGAAVEIPVRGEDTRDVVLRLLSTYLGVTGINKSDICACHRLRNPKVILVRFTHLDNSDRVYRARTKPKRQGLLIFESLTAERLSVIEMIKALRNDPRSSVLSYFTQAGKIFVKTSESRDVRPIEIPFGCGPDQIRDLCEGRKVDPSDTTIRDQFRAIHGNVVAHGVVDAHGGNPWVTVQRNRNKHQHTRVLPTSHQSTHGAQGVQAGRGLPVSSGSGVRTTQGSSSVPASDRPLTSSRSGAGLSHGVPPPDLPAPPKPDLPVHDASPNLVPAPLDGNQTDTQAETAVKSVY